MTGYPGLKQGHVIQQVEQDGAIIVLEDGARFRAYSGFHNTCAAWQPEHMVRVKENPRNPEHPYKIINIHVNQEAEVQWLEGDE